MGREGREGEEKREQRRGVGAEESAGWGRLLYSINAGCCWLRVGRRLPTVCCLRTQVQLLTGCDRGMLHNGLDDCIGAGCTAVRMASHRAQQTKQAQHGPWVIGCDRSRSRAAKHAPAGGSARRGGSFPFGQQLHSGPWHRAFPLCDGPSSEALRVIRCDAIFQHEGARSSDRSSADRSHPAGDSSPAPEPAGCTSPTSRRGVRARPSVPLCTCSVPLAGNSEPTADANQSNCSGPRHGSSEETAQRRCNWLAPPPHSARTPTDPACCVDSRLSMQGVAVDSGGPGMCSGSSCSCGSIPWLSVGGSERSPGRRRRGRASQQQRRRRRRRRGKVCSHLRRRRIRLVRPVSGASAPAARSTHDLRLYTYI